MTVGALVRKYYDSKASRKTYGALYDSFKAGEIDFDTWEVFYSIVSHWQYRPDVGKVCELRFVSSGDVREYGKPTWFPVSI